MAERETQQMEITEEGIIDDGKNKCIPDSFTSPDILYNELIQKVKQYHPSADVSLIEKAFRIANGAHEGQLRKSGEPYIIHPICVGIILASLEMDKETIVAGLLHDVVEDTVMTIEEIESEFSAEVALLVDGVTKLTQLNYDADKVEMQAENLRKMFLAMAKDIRVILIKLADRLHNMRTLQFMKPEKQREKARETMDIYAPIAQRLGISKIKIELDDLSLKYLEPEAYEDLVVKLNERKTSREQFILEIMQEVGNHISEGGIVAKVDGRVKHLFSIYRKMVNQNKSIDQIYDLFAVRIIVDSIQDCYAALGIIHAMYKPMPGRFKDYIAMPKPNMYQSLHTTVIGQTGLPFEIQIRTYEMHKTAEFGIAAHWKYKETSNGKKVGKDQEEEKMNWLRQILEWQNDMSDNREFMNLLRNDLDLFSESVYCFTPTGDVKVLPNGSTPIDFAYSVHSAVGNCMVGARVNGKLVPIEHVLQNGDRVDIITSQNSKGPSRDWLKIVKSAQAKSKINQWFKAQLKEENILKGKEMIQNYCKMHTLVVSDLLKPEYTEKIMRKYGFKDWDSVMAAVGHGGLKEGQVVNKLVDEYEKANRKAKTDKQILNEVAEGGNKAKNISSNVKGSGIIVKGMDDLAVRFSRCCSPVPGDPIVGFITRGRGISIHRADCINILHMSDVDKFRLMEAAWQDEDKIAGGLYNTEIKIIGMNRSGLLVDISKIFTERQIDLSSVNVRVSKQGMALFSMSFAVRSKEELASLMEKIRQVESVLEIERTAG